MGLLSPGRQVGRQVNDYTNLLACPHDESQPGETMRKFPAMIARTALAAAVLAPALAAAQQQINILMFQDSSCAGWSKTANNKVLRAQYEFWIRGFVSGHNYANPARQVPTGKLPGGEQLYAYLDQYCLDNPNSSFVGGAFRLVEQYRVATPSLKSPAPAPAPAPKKDAPKAPAPVK